MRDGVAAMTVNGARLTGTVLTLPGATAAELLAEPFDVVWVDLEHGALGPLDAQEMILGAQAAGTYALVRLPADAHGLMTAMLDAGADGVVLADVSDAATASAATQRVAHPPDGTRGWGPRRLTLRQRGTGRRPPRPSVWLQIESATGVECAEAITAVPGIDAVVVGTADLSFSLGTPLDTNAPAMLEAVERVRKAAMATGVALGVAGALDVAPQAVRAAASILVHSTDARLCANAVDTAAGWLRGELTPD
jgi:4-hydroxy-2-oxoheptanedioate aldolase